MHKFSIIIATYNRKDRLQIAIESVINQSFKDWELVIVNDASTDETREYLDGLVLEDTRITVIHNQVNLHKGGARNNGIEHTTGEYICFLDDDDYYLPNHLEVFNQATKENPKTGLFFTMPISKNERTEVLTKRLLQPIENQDPVAYLFHHKNGVPTPRACVKADLAKQLKFNPAIRIGQDTEFFMRIACETPIMGINEHTMVQVRHDDNSGALKNNTGKDRLDGYQYIFSNQKLMEHIPRSLKRYMISYCYRRIADHYEYMNDHWNTWKAAFWSLYYSPFDSDFKIKIAQLTYHFPVLGRIFEKIYKGIKRN